MKKLFLLFTAFSLVLAFSSSVAAQAGDADFEIETVNGQDADQVNQIEIGYRDGIEVGLSGANYENAKFVAFMDGHEMFMGDDEEISIRPEYDLSEGEQELRIERQSRREEDVSKSTKVDIASIDRERDDDSGDSTDDTSETTDGEFEIASIAGEDASKVNDLDVRVGERVDIELEGVDFKESKFLAYIDGKEMHVDEDGIVMVADIKKVGTGQHELKMKYLPRGTSTDSTKINIVDIEDREEDRETGRSEPGEFEIDSIAGKDADQVNELKLSEGEPLEIELDEVNPGETHLNAFIDGEEFPVDEDGVMVTSKIRDLEKGKQTLRIASIFEGEEATDAETEIEVTGIETREERRSSEKRPEEPDSDLYDEAFSPDVDGMEVERGDGEITVTVTEEGLSNDGGEVVVGDSIEDLTKLNLNFARGMGGKGAARLKIEEKDTDSVQTGDVEVNAVLKLSGKNLELLAPTLRYAVENDWADKHGFDEAIRERGGGRENTEIGFYDVDDWKRFDTRLRDSTDTHSIYSLAPRRIDQELSLESKENTIAIGGNPEGGMNYAEGPQGQCQSFENKEAVPPGWTTIEKTCAEMKQIQREREQLRGSINQLKDDLKSEEDRGDQEDIEDLNKALNETENGNLDQAENTYEEVQDRTAKGFLRGFIIQTVKDVFPF